MKRLFQKLVARLRSQTEGRLPSREQLLVLVPLMLVYAAAVLLATGSVATGPGVFAALMGAVAGILVARSAGESRIRVPVVILTAAVLSGLAVGLAGALGNSVLLARCMGTTLTPWLLDALTFGVVTFSVTLVLRVMTETIRVCAVLEMAVLAGGVVLTFLPHRDLHLGQPRNFSDWIFSGGHDPVRALMGIGILTIGTLLLVVQRWGSSRRLLQSAAALAVLLTVAAWSVSHLPADILQPEPENGDNGLEVLPSGDEGLEVDGDREGEQSRQDEEPQGQQPADDGGADRSGTSSDQPKPDDGRSSSEDSGSNDSGSGDSRQNDSGNDDARPESGQGRSAPPRQPEPWPQPSGGSEQSAAPIALVEIDAEYQPHQRAWYFRQNACSVFNGHRLVRSASDLDTDVPFAFPVEPLDVPEVPQPENASRRISSRVFLLQEQARPFGLVSPVSFAPLDNPDPSCFRMAYRVESRVLVAPAPENGEVADPEYSPLSVLLARPAGNSDWAEETRAIYLRGPDDPRYRELADAILEEAGLAETADHSPLATALVFGQWIAKNTTYSSRADHRGGDPAASFLFGSRRGYCVHIAHAMVYLCRARGIPSRAAMGFAVDVSRASRTNTMLVSGSDAHSWPEIYLQDIGWIVVDTSPEKIDSREPQPAAPDKATEQYLHNVANQSDNPVPYEPQTRFSVPLPSLPWLLAATVLTLYGVKFWRRFCPRCAEDGDLYRVCLRSVLDQLAEIGIRRQFGETREAFAARVASLIPEFTSLTQAHVTQAVGDTERLSGDQWRELTREAGRRIVAVSTRAQQMIAWLNPVAWILVR